MDNTTLWRLFLDRLQENIRPQSIHETWTVLASDYPDKDARLDVVINLLVDFFVVPVGLAAFTTPLEEAPQQLEEMAQALASLDYQTGQQHLSH
ncbi:MAG: hypothetical protein H5T63_11310, partial [Chloroflexi bacterium]|nr:hypothetical protein [Chloroflexota bacterium]